MFNLLKDPWIQVYQNNETKKIGLFDLFKNMEQIEDIIGTIVEKIAVIRLLLCITQAALDGPKNEKDYEKCKNRIQNSSLCYLKKWEKSFDLYGSFLQVSDLKKIVLNSNKGLKTIIFERAEGDQHTLFDLKSRDRNKKLELTPEKIAMSLLTYQIFVPGGFLKVLGVTSGLGSIPVNILLTIIQGKNLLETVYFNLISKDKMLEDKKEFGKPIWEFNIKNNLIKNPEKWKLYPSRSYLYNLVPLSRSIYIEENKPDFYMADGIRIEKNKFVTLYRDPMGTTYLNKNKLSSYLLIDPDKASWRSLQSILSNGKNGGKGAYALSNLFYLKKNKLIQKINILTGGLSCNKAKIIDFCEWSYSVDLSMCEELPIILYEELIDNANFFAGRIKEALDIYRKVSNQQKSFCDSLKNQALRTYWGILESRSNELIKSICTCYVPPIKKEKCDWWKILVKNEATKAFETACNKNILYNPKAYVQALNFLRKDKK